MGCRKLEYYGREALGETTKNLEVVYAKKGMRKKKCINYYPFGMQQPGRTYSSNSYRYGFNGAEKDDEVKGSGNSYDLGLRNYDPRLGRMFSVDPRSPEYPWQTSYAYHRNSPISVLDYLGGGDGWYTDADGNNVYDHSITTEQEFIDSGITGTWIGDQLTPKSAAGGLGSIPLIAYAASGYDSRFLTTDQISNMGTDLLMHGEGLNNLLGSVTATNSTNNSSYFMLDDNFSPKDFYSLVTNSFARGVGYENYVFSAKSQVSADLADTYMTWQALKAWDDGGRVDGTFNIGRSPGNGTDLAAEWITEPRNKGYFATITHTMGSASFHISQGESQLQITVVNSTNVASATGANAEFTIMGTNVMGNNTGYTRPQGAGAQPWTNVSQTINMSLTIGTVNKILSNYNE